MATLLPCDSVSQNGSGSDSLQLSSVRVEPPDSMSYLFGSISTMSSSQLQAASRCMERYYDSYRDYCFSVRSRVEVESVPAATSVVSSVASVGSGSGSSLSGSRLRSARRAANWRASKVLPNSFPSGYCYTRLFRDRARQSVASELLSWPTVCQVMSQPGDLLVSAVLNDDLRLVKTSVGYHLITKNHVLEGQESWDLYGALTGLAQRSEFLDGTFGAAARRWSTGHVDADTIGLLQLGDKLGGFAFLFKSKPVPAPVFVHGNCTVVSCPGESSVVGGNTVFLAGTDEDDGTMGWRADAANHLAAVDCVLLSPRYSFVDAQWQASLDYAPFKEKLDWEVAGLRDADFVFFNFLPGTTSSVSLLELGACLSRKVKVVVSCPDGYLRAANVRHFCDANAIEWHFSFDSAMSSLIGLLQGSRAPVQCTSRDQVGLPLSVLGQSGAWFPSWTPGMALLLGRRGSGRSSAELTDVLAVDCEMVTAREPKLGSRNILGRVSVVNYYGAVVYDSFVFHDDAVVVNTNLNWGSGITWDDLRPRNGAREFSKVCDELSLIFEGKIVVGYDINNDLKVLDMLGATGFVPRDVQRTFPVDDGPKPGLKRMTAKYLSRAVQGSSSGHSSVEDALATMALWRVRTSADVPVSLDSGVSLLSLT